MHTVSSRKISHFFHIFLFLTFSVFFSSCGLFSSEENKQQNEEKKSEHLPAYYSFATEKLSVFPLDHIFAERENFSQEEKTLIKKFSSSPEKTFEGQVFVNTTLIYGKEKTQLTEKYTIQEEKYFSLKKNKKGVVRIDNEIYIDFAKNILKEGDVIRIISESENAQKLQIPPIIYSYEQIFQTKFFEIDPVVSWKKQENTEKNILVLEFPFSIQEDKENRVKNLFQVFQNIREVSKKNDIQKFSGQKKSTQEIARAKEIVQKKLLTSETFYNSEKESIRIEIPEESLHQIPNIKYSSLDFSSRHYTGEKNITLEIPQKNTKTKVSLGQTFKTNQDFFSDIKILFPTGSPAFYDKGEKNSPEFLDNRKNAKQEFIKNFASIPKINITEENIFLTPEKAIITTLLQPETSYQVSYRHSTNSLQNSLKNTSEISEEDKNENIQNFILETPKFSTQGIKLSEQQTLFTTSNIPELKIFSFPPPQTADKKLKLSPRDIIICRISAEEYEAVEEGKDWRFEKFYKEVFPKYLSQWTENEQCITETQNFSELNLSISLENILKKIPVHNTSNAQENTSLSGMYLVSLLPNTNNSKNTPLVESDIEENMILLSVSDSHIIYKHDTKNNDFFWIHDVSTGEPQENSEVYIIDSSWDHNTKTSLYTEKFLGKTNADGILEANRGGEIWDFGGSTLRFLIKKDGKFSGLISSGWDSGISAWNFGMSQSNYYAAKKQFLAHIVPDRKLYEPGEKIFVKAVVRKNQKTLTLPNQDAEYMVQLRDPQYKTLATETVSPNEFGSLFFEYEIPKNATRGTYSIEVSQDPNMGSEDEEVLNTRRNISLGRISVEVQDFKLPSFEIKTSLQQSLENNADEISGNISLSYFSGGSMPKGKFSYKIYKKRHYSSEYWDFCYWGCYGSAPKKYVTAGKGEITNGSGKFLFQRDTQNEDKSRQYEYIAEVTVSDETGEQLTGSGTILVDAKKYSSHQEEVNINLSTEKNIFTIKEGEKNGIQIALQANKKWQNSFDYQQNFFLIRREYTTKHFKDVSGKMRAQSNFEDFIEEKISITSENFSFDETGKAVFTFYPQHTGEYRFFTKGHTFYETPTLQKFWVYPEDENTVMNMPLLDDVKINIIQEKQEYKIGETAKILIQSPFRKGKALITIEKNEILSTQTLPILNNVALLEIPVTKDFVPNVYVSIIVQSENTEGKKPNTPQEYRLGYAEIIVNQNEKKLDITLDPQKNTEEISENKNIIFAPREKVTLNISTQNKYGDAKISELSVAVIDESLISMIGNINMDILKSFYAKVPFSLGTAMSSIAMKKNLYFSRRGIIGGSGSKGGSSGIFTRSLFSKTAFYKGDVVTDEHGKASVEFSLPDTLGQFRIVVLGNTKDNFFGASEKIISVQQDIVIEEQFPLIFRRGDSLILEANIFNNTEKNEEFEIKFFAPALEIKDDSQAQTLKIPANTRKKVSFSVNIPENIAHDIDSVDYEIIVKNKNNENNSEKISKKIQGDHIKKSISLAKTPLVETLQKENFVLNSQNAGNSSEIFLHTGDINPQMSRIEISVGNIPQLGIENILTSLAKYPHGCLEQTTSSTLPNALLLQFSEIIDLDMDKNMSKETIQKNIDYGIKRIFSMQQENGGFAYWQGETRVNHHYSPYAIWGLAKMQELGQNIDDKKLKKAENYVIERFKNYNPQNPENTETQQDDWNNWERNAQRAELVESLRALALLKSDFFLKATSIISTEKEHFSDHEKIMYALALLEYDQKKYKESAEWMLSQVNVSEKNKNTHNRYYYNTETDNALLAQAWQYIDATSIKSIESIETLKSYNLNSYFYSTATKNQTFLAFLQHLKGFQKSTKNQEVEIRIHSPEISDTDFAITKKITLSPENPHQKIILSYSDLLAEGYEQRDLELFAAPVKISTPESNKDHVVFGTALSFTTPKNKTDIVASKNGIRVSRAIFSLRNINGKISTLEHERQKLSGKNIGLKLGEQYQMEITVSSDTRLRDIAVENYLPSGVKVLNSAFKNNASTFQDQSGRYWDFYWPHEEIKKDMVFASNSYFSGQKKHLKITFVPTQEGEFFMPPALAYAMYQPEIRANTEYIKITVGR